MKMSSQFFESIIVINENGSAPMFDAITYGIIGSLFGVPRSSRQIRRVRSETLQQKCLCVT